MQAPIRAGRSRRVATTPTGPAPIPSTVRRRRTTSKRSGARGARYFVLPRPAFSWRRRYPELVEWLDAEGLRLHQDEHLLVWDLAPDHHDRPVLDPAPVAKVLVCGTYAAHRTGPPPVLVTELGASRVLAVEQRWRSDASPKAVDVGDADFVVHVRDDVIAPARFLDRLVATQIALGADRLQPTHTEGPAGGPPITERHFGLVAREVDAVTPLPVLSVRAGAAPTGPTVLSDDVTIGLRRPLNVAADGLGNVGRTWTLGPDRRPVARVRTEPDSAPRISVLIATYERPDLLRECLTAFADQTLATSEYEVVVVDDGSERDDLDAVLAEFDGSLAVTGLRIAHAGRSAAKNVAVMLARAPVVLFFDDDDRAARDYLERHLAAHDAKPAEGVAILGHTEWAPELDRSPLMHYITDVDRLMFAYERLGDGQELDWRGFWEGRISCKRAFLLRHALHDQRLVYSIDIEMGWRLAPAGMRVVYDAGARSFMARPIDFDAFCRRTEAKGRAHALIAALHAGTEIAERLHVEDAAKIWDESGAEEPRLRRRVAELEARAELEPEVLPDLHEAYRRVFRLLHTKGAATTGEETRHVTEPPTTVQPFPNTDPELAYDATPEDRRGEPLLSITLPVWSRTPELAAMAQRTVERIWEVASIPTEVVVVDNGSPHQGRIAAKVYRYPENKGVATGWNTGIRLARAPMVVVLNSDCRVEPGWDRALYEAASDGRRVAFPYTDHCDGQGFTRPDQGGTAGWCFMMRRALYDEIGVFDEWFNPAYCEDTDYWHRAWQAGVDLAPVPARAVVHARRTTASTDAAGTSSCSRATATSTAGSTASTRTARRRTTTATSSSTSAPTAARARPGPRSRPAADLRHRPQQDGDDVAARGVRHPRLRQPPLGRTGVAALRRGLTRRGCAAAEPARRPHRRIHRHPGALGALRAARPSVSREPVRPHHPPTRRMDRQPPPPRRDEPAPQGGRDLPRDVPRRGRSGLARALAPARRCGAASTSRVATSSSSSISSRRRSGSPCATSSAWRRRAPRSPGRTAASRTDRRRAGAGGAQRSGRRARIDRTRARSRSDRLVVGSGTGAGRCEQNVTWAAVVALADANSIGSVTKPMSSRASSRSSPKSLYTRYSWLWYTAGRTSASSAPETSTRATVRAGSGHRPGIVNRCQPPGRSTRKTSPNARRGSRTCSKMSDVRTRSKVSGANVSAMRSSQRMPSRTSPRGTAGS